MNAMVVHHSFAGGVNRRWGMKRICLGCSLGMLVCLLLFSLVGIAQENAIPVQILTNNGDLIEGRLTNLALTIRLNVTAPATNVGPAQALDILTSAISQITVNFPKIVIETPNRTYVGPFSAFAGIPEVLTIEQQATIQNLKIAGLRAIALRGVSMHEPPPGLLGMELFPRTETGLSSQLAKAKEEESSLALAQPIQQIFPRAWGEEISQTTTEIPEDKTSWLLLLAVTSIASLFFFTL